jgi:hypothetical protein
MAPVAITIVSSSCLLNPRWRRKVLSAGPREYDWLDVFLAAMLRDEWRPFESRLVEGLVCLAAAEAHSDAAWPFDHQVGEAANSFRYERNLITGDETIAWLECAGLTLDAWTDYLTRDLLHDRWRDRLGDLLPRYSASVTVTDIAVAAEGICSGTFDGWCRALAGRAAFGVLQDDSADLVVTTGETEIARMRAGHAEWLTALDPRDISARVVHLGQLESAFHARTRAAVTGEALASQVARHRLEWMRVDLERLSFDAADAAREAACCVRDDGRTLSEVAIDSRRSVRDTRTLLEQLEPELRDAVLSAGVDELVGPVAVGSRYEIAWVVGKRPADVADALVCARAEAEVVDQMIARALLTHVRWNDRPAVVTGSRHERACARGASTE